MRSPLHWLLSATLLILPVSASAQDAPSEQSQIEALLQGTDDMFRGNSSTATLTMSVKTDRYERTVKMQSWTQGSEKSLIRILEPAKERGVSTLKVGDNIWNYLPKVDRTMKVPASMMSGSWMGSHLTNDDLVQESRLSEDFTYTLTQQPGSGSEQYVVELQPKPDAPVVWGKIVASFRADKLPTEIRYYDEGGDLVRTMSYTDVKEVDGRNMPTRFTITPADKPGEYTTMTYNDLDFGVEIPESTFSLQSLRR